MKIKDYRAHNFYNEIEAYPETKGERLVALAIGTIIIFALLLAAVIIGH